MRIVKSLFRRGVRQLNKWRLISPELTSRLLYFNVFGRFPDIDNPKDLNEKILAQAFRGDTSQWSRLADKYAVRAYVEEKGLGEILVPLYGVWDRVEDIDFEGLPDSFVLKTTDGFARVIFIKDKDKTDFRLVRRILQKWMRERRMNDEPHYQKIHRRIIAEKFMSSEGGEVPADYKIYCCNGKPSYCLVCMNRNIETLNVDFVMYRLPGWEKIDEIEDGWRTDSIVPRPDNLGEMMDYAAALAEGFPLVRIDFYDIDGKIYFGEVTFTPSAGRMLEFRQPLLDEIGSKVKLQ